MDLKSTIRAIPDFPKKGIIYRDITTLCKEAAPFDEAVKELCLPFQEERIDKVVGIESRGFIFGGAAACRLGTGFVPARKPGKLPAETVSQSYELEYGEDEIELHKDAILPGERVLVIDDLIATGGTAAATCRLIEKLGGAIVGGAFLIELITLRGREKLGDIPVHVLVRFEGE